MVFLRPMIIRNQEDLNALSMDRYDLIRAAQQGVGPAAAERDHADQRRAGGAGGAAADAGHALPQRHGAAAAVVAGPAARAAGARRLAPPRRRPAASEPAPVQTQ